MNAKQKPAGYILHKDEIDAQAFRFRHPLGGDRSECVMSALGRAAGLKRVGVNIARVPAGKEAFVYHRHHGEEEWVYILEGEARSEIDDVAETVRAGDFIGYPAGVAHPTAPSRLTASRFCASTANSIGNSRNTCRQKPLTIMLTASSAEIPRCRQ